MDLQVLIVGHCFNLLELLDESLAGQGALVVRFESGSQVLEYCGGNTPSLIFITHPLPDMDGVELAGLLQGGQYRVHLPTVIVTSVALWETAMHRGHEMGVWDVLTDTLHANVLPAKVGMLLRAVNSGYGLKKELERLFATNDELSTFACIAAHDLKAPLRMIDGYMQLLGETDNNADKRQRFAHNIQRAVQRMFQLIDSLLEYARIDTSYRPSGRVDLDHCLQVVMRDIKGEKTEVVAVVHYTSMPVVMGDKRQLQYLLRIILDNALSYVPSQRTPEIAIRSTVIDQTLQLSFQDNGMGFDMSRHEELFKPLNRLTSTGEGLGIGLATAYKIVKQHKGAIWATSQEGCGSTFYIQLPMSEIEIVSYQNRERVDTTVQF